MIEETLKRGSKIQGVGVRSLDEPMNLGVCLGKKVRIRTNLFSI